MPASRRGGRASGARANHVRRDAIERETSSRNRRPDPVAAKTCGSGISGAWGRRTARGVGNPGVWRAWKLSARRGLETARDEWATRSGCENCTSPAGPRNPTPVSLREPVAAERGRSAENPSGPRNAKAGGHTGSGPNARAPPTSPHRSPEAAYSHARLLPAACCLLPVASHLPFTPSPEPAISRP